MAHFVQYGIDRTPELKLLTLVPSLLYFGLPALLFVFGFWAITNGIALIPLLLGVLGMIG